MSSIYQVVVVVQIVVAAIVVVVVVVVVAAIVVVVVVVVAAVGLHVWHLQWLFSPMQELFLHNVIFKMRCVVCEIADFHGIDLENFFLLGSYSL